MPTLKLVRKAAAITLAAVSPLALAAVANAQLAPAPGAPPSTTQRELPPAAKPDPMPSAKPDASPGAKPDVGAKPDAGNAMVGLDVFGSDGKRVGQVADVRAAPDGKVQELHVKVGGIMGLGGKIVAVPAERFARAGERVQIAMTSDEVSKLPSVESKG